MFAPRPELVAAELVRVCRPGGTIAMANWTPTGFIGQMFKVISGAHRAVGHAVAGTVGRRNDGSQSPSRGNFGFEVRAAHLSFDYPFSPDAVVDFYRANYGPMSRAFASLDTVRPGKAAELTSCACGLTTTKALGIPPRWTRNISRSSRLAARVSARPRTTVPASGGLRESSGKLAGATALRRAPRLWLRSSRRLSDADWQAPGSVGGTDKRSVGVVVHHVASMYPVEVDVAKAVAGGNAVTEVTWEAVAQLNGKHAIEAAGATKADDARTVAAQQPRRGGRGSRIHRRAVGSGGAVLAELRCASDRAVCDRRSRASP